MLGKALKNNFIFIRVAEAWYNQGVGNETLFVSIFRQRCLDIDFQNWCDEINSYSKLRIYRLFKINLATEPYLTIQMKPVFRLALFKFRVSAHSLMVEKGRHLGLQLNERKCPICLDVVEDEFHFLFVCPLYDDLRNQYIPSFYTRQPLSQYKFIELMNNRKPETIRNCARYLFYASQKRASFLEDLETM